MTLDKRGYKAEIFLTYEAMRRLIDESLDWKGNMRKLQAVARQLIAHIDLEQNSGEMIELTRYHIDKALQDIGMLEALESLGG